MRLMSGAFRNGGRIPKRYTADGDNIPPPLSWSGVPAGTKELLLICEDPDAPTPEPFVHWVVYKLQPGLNQIPEGGLHRNSDAQVGLNSRNEAAYLGPAPPLGDKPHRYHFHLYALEEQTRPIDKATPQALKRAIAGLVLAESDLEGIYSRLG